MEEARVTKGLATRGQVVAAALVALALLHAVQVWGYWGLFWGDPGQVLHQIERLALGEPIYRGVFVTSPPLGYWVLAAGARWLGSDPGQISLVTTALFVSIVLAWWGWAQRTIDDSLDAVVAIPALLFATALACALGVALPLGTYAPGSLVGFLCLLLGLIASGAPARATSWQRGLVIGAACAGCVLAKQDFWAPALFLASSVAVATAREGRFVPLAATAASGIACLGYGVWRVAGIVGWENLAQVATGYGVAGESGFGRSAPSWDRLTIETLTLAAFALALAVATWLAGASRTRWRSVAGLSVLAAGALLAIRFAATSTGGDPVAWLVLESRVLRQALARTPLPFCLPIVTGAWLLLRRRSAPSAEIDRALWLVGLCIAAQLRRGFEMTEWFVALLELPTLLVAARVLAPNRWRAPARFAIAGLTLLALFCTWRLGTGFGTARGRLPVFQSERGPVHFPLNQLAAYERLRDTLARRDPTRTRPVFSFGHNGGIAYWLRRPNPTPLTYGFAFAPISPAAAVALLWTSRPPAFLVYSAAYEHAAAPTTDGLLTHWSTPTRQNTFMTSDLVWFERARAGCEEIDANAGGGRLRIFDCAPLAPEPR